MNIIFDPVRAPRVHRDFENDLPKEDPQEEDSIQRGIGVALPLVSLYRPCGQILSIGSSCTRFVVTASEIGDSLESNVNILFSTAALAGTVFYSQTGMMLTTTHDMYQNVVELTGTEHKYQAAMKLLNNATYLTLLMYGSLELQVISLATQVILNLGTAFVEFGRERYLEVGTNLFLSGVRFGQMNSYVKLYQREQEMRAAIANIFVGKMREKWQFPSDHLPVGVNVDDEFEAMSWNVMNTCYMRWVKELDSQGLNGSMLTELDVPVNEDGLTKRDVLILEMMQSMLERETTGLIALQECSEQFLSALEATLPQNWHIARSFDLPKDDQEVVLYNDKFVTYHMDLSETTLNDFPSFPGRAIAQSVFSRKSDNRVIRLFNAHIPGDPTKPGPEEFAKYVAKFASSDTITIALGDCNFERDKMISAYSAAGLLDERYPEEVLHTPWPTNIHPDGADHFPPGSLKSKGIDHTLVLNAKSKSLDIHEVLRDERLEKTIAQLQGREA